MHNFPTLFLFLSAAILFNVNHTESKIVEGFLQTKFDWHFLTRFCFYNDSGHFTLNISYPDDPGFYPLELFFYYDNVWDQVYPMQRMTCKEKKRKLRPDQIVSLKVTEPEMRSKICRRELNELTNGSVIYCNQTLRFRSQRERWWYIVVSNCDTKVGMVMKYHFEMMNGNSHFSADESYILHVDIVFLVLYALLFLISCYQSYALQSRHLFHATFKLLVVSVLCNLFGIALLCWYYIDYSKNGISNEGIKQSGRGLRAVGSTIFLLLLVLVAKGYTITRARLKFATSSKITAFITVYSLIYTSLFFYEQHFFDPGEVLYTYESPAGYGLILLNLVALAWFLYGLLNTARKYPTKRSFFVILLLMYTVWFVSIPVVAMMATLLIPDFRREKIVNAVDLIVAFRAHLFFMILTWPAKFNRLFPYHVRTTQINALAKMDETVPGQTLDNFSHYQYAPTTQYQPPPPAVHGNPRQSEDDRRRNNSNLNGGSRNEMTTSLSNFESPKFDNNSALPDVA